MSEWSDAAIEMQVAVKETFGDAVFYTPAGGVTVQLAHAVFQAAHKAVDVQAGVEISSVGPVLGVQLSDLPAPPEQDDGVTVAGVAYKVTDVQPDGYGWAVLVLVKA